MCPETCPATCEADQTICADGERDELGCREQESCHNQTRNIHGEFCPYESVCPALCNITEVLCDNGIDEEGCKHPSICYQPEKNYYGEFCNFTCPGICSDEEILCPAIRLTSMDVKDSLPVTTEQQALMKLSFAQILQIVRYIATLLKFYVQLVSMKWDAKHLMSV